MHFDVDVVDFVDLPLSENTGLNIGMPFAAARAALAVLAADPRVATLTVTEHNPAHGAADGSTTRRAGRGARRRYGVKVRRWPSAASGPNTRSCCCSARITCMTALISARWVNACGKLPRWRPVRGVDLLGVQPERARV